MIQRSRELGVVYLACPYSHLDPEVRLQRFERATMAAAHLIEGGRIVYSPITMTHPIDLVLAQEGETLGSDYWVRFDEAFMEFCAEMQILKLEGWEASRGIQREVEWFRSHDRPVRYLEWEDVAHSPRSSES